MPNCKSPFLAVAVTAVFLGAAPDPAAAQGVHPGWSVVNLRPDGNFRPMVTGLGFLSDGRLVVCHWGGLHSAIPQRQLKGAVYILKGVTGDAPVPTYTTFASGLEEPAGMLVKDDRIYVTGGEKLIELPDANKDGQPVAYLPQGEVARAPGNPLYVPADLVGAEVRDARGSLVAEIPGQGRRSARIATAGWPRGLYTIAVRAEGGMTRRLAAIR